MNDITLLCSSYEHIIADQQLALIPFDHLFETSHDILEEIDNGGVHSNTVIKLFSNKELLLGTWGPLNIEIMKLRSVSTKILKITNPIFITWSKSADPKRLLYRIHTQYRLAELLNADIDSKTYFSCDLGPGQAFEIENIGIRFRASVLNIGKLTLKQIDLIEKMVTLGSSLSPLPSLKEQQEEITSLNNRLDTLKQKLTKLKKLFSTLDVEDIIGELKYTVRLDNFHEDYDVDGDEVYKAFSSHYTRCSTKAHEMESGACADRSPTKKSVRFEEGIVHVKRFIKNSPLSAKSSSIPEKTDHGGSDRREYLVRMKRAWAAGPFPQFDIKNFNLQPPTIPSISYLVNIRKPIFCFC